jgi:uncharacterized membrane protein YgcG
MFNFFRRVTVGLMIAIIAIGGVLAGFFFKVRSKDAQLISEMLSVKKAYADVPSSSSNGGTSASCSSTSCSGGGGTSS